MKAQERLRAGQLAAMDGRHEEALEQFVWFHDHALEEEPALYGVRLSFALAYWKELGEQYPKAMRVLRRTRDEKVKSLLRGEGDRHLFDDVVAINEVMKEDKRTCLLYVRLAKARPELAQSCASVALPSVVAAGNFKLAEKLMPQPIERVRHCGSLLSKDVERQKSRPRGQQIAVRRALIQNYISDVQMLLSVLEARSRTSEAATVRALAVSVLSSPSVRRAVRTQLVPQRP